MQLFDTLKNEKASLFVFFHLYPPVMRKQRWRYWTNPHSLRSCPFPSFPVVYLTSYHWICYQFEAISRDNHRKAPYPRSQQRVRRRWELNLDHTIVITRTNPLG